MPIRSVRLEDPKGILRKLDWNVMVEPEVRDILKTGEERMKRQGSGMGAKANSISATVSSLSAKATTTLRQPRTTGASWQRYMIVAALPRALRASTAKAVAAMLQRWSS